ncbi:hypothetical protein A2U01_0101044, partial [Trifolium medium]|nr:hypothetical protein [Trifolium medium]
MNLNNLKEVENVGYLNNPSFVSFAGTERNVKWKNE